LLKVHLGPAHPVIKPALPSGWKKFSSFLVSEIESNRYYIPGFLERMLSPITGKLEHWKQKGLEVRNGQVSFPLSVLERISCSTRIGSYAYHTICRINTLMK